MPDTPLELYDPRNGGLALKIEALTGVDALAAPQRSNYFTVFWVQQGRGTFWADLGQYDFAASSLLFLVPYQCFRIQPAEPLRGVCIQFHANFFCIETYHEQVGCNGVLFNDLYGEPLVVLGSADDRELQGLVESLRRELSEQGLAHPEVLLAYLKIFLVKATRLKLEQQAGQEAGSSSTAVRLPPVLDDLRQLVEAHYRAEHSPAWYANRLHLTAKALAKLTKTHLHKTLTELIRERILRQAKWDLLHTLKPVKQIAAELGFQDELYFSRLFKQSAGCAPTFFREFETAIRGGKNLSMT